MKRIENRKIPATENSSERYVDTHDFQKKTECIEPENNCKLMEWNDYSNNFKKRLV